MGASSSSDCALQDPMSLEQCFGKELIRSGGTPFPTSTLSEDSNIKVIGILVVAHWCPNCRGFTPELFKWYKQEKAKEYGGLFEIIFVSCDQDENAFTAYLKEMPWPALTFTSDKKEALGDRFGVTGIPRLIFINAKNCVTLLKDGRDHVTSGKTVQHILDKL